MWHAPSIAPTIHNQPRSHTHVGNLRTTVVTLSASAFSASALRLICHDPMQGGFVQVFMHAVEAGVPLEASSIMVTIDTLDRAGRWALAEAVFTTTMLFTIDVSALLAMPLLEASPPLGATAPADGRAQHVSADAAGELGGPPPQHTDHGAAERRRSPAPAAGESLPEDTSTVGMLVAPPGPGLHAPRPDEDDVAAALLRAMLALRWRVLSHSDAGMRHSELLGLLQADAATLGPGAVDSAGNAHPAGIYGAAAERGPSQVEGRQSDVSVRRPSCVVYVPVFRRECHAR